MRKVLLLLMLIVLTINIKAQENAPTSDFAEVEQYVLDKLKVWQERGKYEPSAEYEQRVSLVNRNKEIEKYTLEALKMFAPRKIRTIGNVTLGEYNPDRQVFPLKIQNSEDIAIPVPIDQAADFEKKWKNYYFTNLKYGLYQHRYVIYSAEIIVDNKIYAFDAKKYTDWGNNVILTISQTEGQQAQAENEYSKLVKYVKEKTDLWKERGEFESSEVYAKRTSAENQKKKEAEFTTEALNLYAPNFINLDSIKLGKYDPDNQAFTLNIPNSVDIEIPVPTSKAPQFKKSWLMYTLKNASFALYKNQYVINTLGIYEADSLIYQYNTSKSAEYANEMLLAIDLNNLDESQLTASSSGLSSKNPPLLLIDNISFTDADGNNRIDADEKTKISFKIKNSGEGVGYELNVKITELNGVKGLMFNPRQTIGNLAAGAEKDVLIQISALMTVPTAKANFKIEVVEANKFDADAQMMTIDVNEFVAPNVVVADYKFATESGGKIELGSKTILKVIVQNQSLGTAKDVTVKFTNPANVVPVDQSKFSFPLLSANESKTIDYEFIITKRYDQTEVPIEVKISESYGKYGQSVIEKVSLEESLAKNSPIQIIASSGTGTITSASLSSDVDKNIPENAEKNEKRYALVIGNENYTKYQPGLATESNVDFANTDASVFAQYLEKTLGVPKDNIVLIIDAISSKMRAEIEKLCKMAEYSNGEAELIFYYAGHGFPDEVSKESYIMPVDISGARVTDGIKLSELYAQLTANPVKRVTVFLDACFSGGGRNGGLLAARGVKIKPKDNPINGNLVVFAASSGEQTSLPYKDKLHGMFTYFLLKKLQDSKGEATYKELADYIKSQVQLNAVKINSKVQNPDLLYSSQCAVTWEEWKVK